MTSRSLIVDTEGIEISLRQSDVSDSLELKQLIAFIGIKRHFIFNSPLIKKIYTTLNVKMRCAGKQFTVIGEKITFKI